MFMCAICGKIIDDHVYGMDIDDDGNTDPLCEECFDNLNAELDGAKGDDDNE